MKTAFITGATAGFGREIARRFIEEGWKVIVSGRREDRLNELTAELGENSTALVFDVRKLNEIQNAVSCIPETFLPINVLVNNAGLALGLEPAHEVNIDDWETMVDTNVKGVMYMTRTILPLMVKENEGHIVNIGSTAGNWPYPGGNVYGGTKAFVQQFSRNIRNDVMGKNIRVTNIEPGMAETEFSIVRFKGDEDKAAKVYSDMQPLTPEDIAEAVYWVVSLPKHVNVNTLELMPTEQAWNAFQIHRNS